MGRSAASAFFCDDGFGQIREGEEEEVPGLAELARVVQPLLVRRCDTGDWELPGGHVIANPRTGQVRQSFAVCFDARPLSGNPAGDQMETSDARWFTAADIPALPIHPATRTRIDHALTPGRTCHIG